MTPRQSHVLTVLHAVAPFPFAGVPLLHVHADAPHTPFVGHAAFAMLQLASDPPPDPRQVHV